MAQRHRRKRKESPIAGLLLAGVLIVGGLAWQHKIPPAILAPGHTVLMGLPASIRAPLLKSIPTDAADLFLDVIGLFALLVVVAVIAGRRSCMRARTLGEMLALDPSQFEEFVADVLRRQSFKNVRRVGGSGDLNADVVARDSNGRSVVVQCKRYKPGNRIGSPAIQTFIGMVAVHHKADRGIFVTTSSYTNDARRLAQQHGITLWDGGDLTRMVKRRPTRQSA